MYTISLIYAYIYIYGIYCFLCGMGLYQQDSAEVKGQEVGYSYMWSELEILIIEPQWAHPMPFDSQQGSWICALP